MGEAASSNQDIGRAPLTHKSVKGARRCLGQVADRRIQSFSFRMLCDCYTVNKRAEEKEKENEKGEGGEVSRQVTRSHQRTFRQSSVHHRHQIPYLTMQPPHPLLGPATWLRLSVSLALSLSPLSRDSYHEINVLWSVNHYIYVTYFLSHNVIFEFWKRSFRHTLRWN